ncbi:hypothetical protein ACWCXH_23990 [Kitasatospora sp. NPDC001660]
MRTSNDDAQPTKRGRAKRIALLTFPCLAAGLAIPGVLIHQAHQRPSTRAAAADTSVATTQVVRTDLADTQTLNGTLGYGGPQGVSGGGPGLVTSLPAAGATVIRGQELYRVNDRPVPLFYGATPLFRALDTPGLVGRDVKTVADNLKALGYSIGDQPAPGTRVTQQPAPGAAPGASSGASRQQAGPGPSAPAASGASGASAPASAGTPATPPPAAATPSVVEVRQGDGVLTSALIDAIKRWQAKAGLPATGSLNVGDIAVLPGAVRISAVPAHAGDPATSALLTVTGTDKVITVPVTSTDTSSMKNGDQVSVTLPDNTTLACSVAQVSTAAQASPNGGSGGGTPGGGATVNVTLSLNDPTAAAHLDSAPVQAHFTTQTRQKVLAVPVGALLAVSQGGYAVQRADGQLLRVQTGLFANGLVEISGTGITEGLRVVTTS